MSNTDNQSVQFTQKQYDYLNKLFPEQSAAKLTNDELRFYSGQRQLIAFVATKIQKG